MARKAELLQQAVLDNFPFMVWLKDMEGRFLAVNSRMAQAAGAPSVETMHGKTDLDFWPHDLAAAYRSDDSEVMRTGRTKAVEELIEIGGERHWYETYKAPVTLAGEVLGTLGFAREIDDRKCIEIALRESQKRHSDIMDYVSDLLALVEVQPGGGFRVLEVSASVERLAGVSRAGWIGRQVDELMGPGIGSRLLELLRDCVERRATVKAELVLPGEAAARILELTLIPVTACRSVSVGRVVAVGRDITLQKQHEAVLRERAELQSRLTRLAEVAPGVVGTYLRRPDGCTHIPPLSPKLEEITGCGAQAVMDDATVFVRAMHPDDVEGYLASLDASARHMVPFHHEFRMLHPRKGEIWLEGRAIPEALPDGSIEWYGFLHDVTQRKLGEEALRDSERQLRALASRRDSERETERKRIARELHDELGQFLTALRMRASLLRVRFGKDNPQLVQAVAEMTQLVDHTMEVVRNAASSLRPAALDMGVASALDWLVQEFTRNYGIPCTLKLEEEAPLGEKAATAIFRIVQESLTNVARHARAGRVEVGLRRLAGRYLLEVRDDGVGFDPAAARAGLGLVSMRERVLQVGGELSLRSAPGLGLLVRAWIPARRTVEA